MTVNFHAQSLPGCLVPHRSRTLSVQFWNAILIGKKNYVPEFYDILLLHPHLYGENTSNGLLVDGESLPWQHFYLSTLLLYSLLLHITCMCVHVCMWWTYMKMIMDDVWWQLNLLQNLFFLLCYFIRSVTTHNFLSKKRRSTSNSPLGNLSQFLTLEDLPEVFSINWYPQVRWILGQTSWCWSVLSLSL